MAASLGFVELASALLHGAPPCVVNFIQFLSLPFGHARHFRHEKVLVTPRSPPFSDWTARKSADLEVRTSFSGTVRVPRNAVLRFDSLAARTGYGRCSR